MNFIIQILLICLVSCCSAVSGKPPKKIINGVDTKIINFPYQVSLQDLKYGHFCGGSIINTNHILTAAHCIVDDQGRFKNRSFTVLSGTDFLLDIEKGENHQVKEVKWHEKYNPNHSYKNDIAIITLTKPIVFTLFQKSIRLPSQDVPVNVWTALSGWGSVQDQVLVPWAELQKSEFQIVDNEKCQLHHPLRIYSSQLCAWKGNNTNVGWGDSGGGLRYRGEIVGIASWFERGNPEAPCIFTRVYPYLPWITNVINNGPADSPKSLKTFKDTFEKIFEKISK